MEILGNWHWTQQTALFCALRLHHHFGICRHFLASSVLYSGTSVIIQNPMTQQLIVVKVAVFILIELVVFPFRCSVILDISTLSLFRGATIWTHLEYSAHAPLPATFFHPNSRIFTSSRKC